MFLHGCHSDYVTRHIFPFGQKKFAITVCYSFYSLSHSVLFTALSSVPDGRLSYENAAGFFSNFLRHNLSMAKCKCVKCTA